MERSVLPATMFCGNGKIWPRVFSISLRLAMLVCFSLFVAAKAQAQVPTITSFSPLSGAAGTTVTIKGTNFNATAANDVVYFGGAQGKVNSATATCLKVTVPFGATTQNFSVLNLGNNLAAQSALPFNIISNTQTVQASNTFTNQTTFSSGGRQGVGVLLSDLNGDGKPDLITAAEGGGTFAFQNNGTPGAAFSGSSFGPAINLSVSSPRGISAADLDGDGKPDIIVNANGNSVAILQNTSTTGGAISMAPAININPNLSGGSSYTAVGDFDGDGKPDIVVLGTINDAGEVVVLQNASTPGNISFTAGTPIDLGNQGRMISVADIDGDGKADIVLTYGFGIKVLLNTSSGNTISFANVVTINTTGAYFLAVADMDGDGKPDVITGVNSSSTPVSILTNTSSPGNVSFTERDISVASAPPTSIAIDDMDGDGKPDIIILSNAGPNTGVYVLTNAGSFNSAIRVSVSGGTNYLPGLAGQAVVAGDLNGDGLPDVAAIAGNGFQADQIEIYTQAPLATTSVNSISLATTPTTGSATSIQYTVSLAGTVAGLSVDNFSLATTGTAAGTISSVTGSGNTRTVTVSKITGAGTLQLNLANSTGISPGISNSLPINGDTYTVIDAPTTQASNVTFTDVSATSATLNWTPGNGNFEMVLMAPVGTPPVLPVNNTGYGFYHTYGGFPFSVGSSWSIVYNNPPTSSAPVDGLTPGTAYTVMVIDYNVDIPNYTIFQYLTAAGASNPATLNTTSLPPTIASFSPASGPVGTLVTINGSNLSSPTALSIGGQPAIVISNDGSTLVAMVMPNATNGAVSLTTAGGTASGSGNFAITNATPPTAQQGAKLIETGGSFAQLGAAVALSADGLTALVGAPQDNGHGDGVVYSWSGSAWTQSAVLTGSGSSGGFFGGAGEGRSVALSADGNTAVLGGNQDNNNEGAFWVFTRNGNTWTQQGAKMVATNTDGGTFDSQGTSVSISADGNTLVEGGQGSNSGDGAAWLFTRSAGVWSQAAELTGTGSGTGHANQGSSVAISADGATILVAGKADNNDRGAVWVFTGSGNTWTQQGTKLTPSDANTGGGGPYFGTSTALSADGNTAIIGGPADASLKGASWIFTRSSSAWSQQGSKLFGAGSVGQAQQGWSVAISADGNTAIEGGLEDNNAVGAGWVFTRGGSVWSQRGPKLIGTGASGSGSQGSSVAIAATGQTALEGASVDNGGVGAAWAFTGATAPATQAASVAFNNTAQTTTTATWTPGNGTSEAVFISQSSSGSPSPANNTTYNANAAFASGDQIGSSGWYCVFNGAGNSVNITGLTANTTYNVMVVDYNGSAGNEQYLTNAGIGDPATLTTTMPPPITAAISAPSSTETSKGPVTFTVTYGGGDPATFRSFLSAADLGGNNSGTVNFSTETDGFGDNYTITIANITGNGTFTISTPGGEARDGDGNQDPGTNSATVNVDNAITLKSITATSTAPTMGPTVQYTVTFSDYVGNLTLNNFTVATTSGNATGIINNVTNNGDNTYSVTVGNITGSGTLQLQLSSTNGLTNINNTTGLVNPSLPFLGDSYTILPSAPTTQASSVTVTNTTQTSVTINWTPGNGASEAVFLENSSVHGSPSPVNNATYNANAAFRSGDQIGGTGWYCIYNGTGSSSVGVTGLSAGSPYQVMVVDYNGAPGGEQYSTASASGNPLAFPTLSAPQLFTGTATGTISACVGTASASPNVEQFSVSGSNLTDNITVTAPSGGAFELSTDGTTYGGSVTLTQLSGSVSNVTVYARSAASDGAGAISGNAVVSTSGATSVNVALSGTVNALATVAAVSNQTVGAGAATTAVAFSGTAGSYTWTNDTPGIGLAASGTGNIASFTAANTGTSPVAATITATPIGGYSYAYIANNGSNNVSVINTASNAVIATIQVGPAPWGVATSPDGKTAYVTNSGDGTVSVINTTANTVVGTPITVGANPEGIAVSPDGSTVYVVNNAAGSVSVISTATNSVIHTITTNGTPTNVIVNSNGSAIYVVRNASVVEYSTSNYTLIKNEGAFDLATDIALSPDNKNLYMGELFGTSVKVNTTTFVQSNLTISPWLSGGMVINADGSRLYVATQTVGVQVVNPTTNTKIATIATNPSNVYGLSLSADGSTLYAALGNNTVAVINTATNTVTSTITVGSAAQSIGNFIATVSGCNGVPTTFTITVNPSPSVTTSGTLAAFSTIAGTASTSTSFNVSGTWLQGTVTATAPTGFEVSTDGNNYGSTATLTPDGSGNISSANVYVRLAAADVGGSYSGHVALTGANLTEADVAVSGTVTSSPTIQASNVTFAGISQTSASIRWTQGNGAKEAVFISQSGAGPISLTNNTNYTVGPTSYNSGSTDATGNWYCVANGVPLSANVSGLSPGATYNVMVIDYNGGSLNEQYSTATAAGNPNSFTTLLYSETITFNPLSSATYGDADIALTASSDNTNVPVTYQSDNENVATIVNGSIHIVAAGAANITASQAGDATHNAATGVAQQLTVNPAMLIITPDNQAINYGASLPMFTASYNQFVNGDNVGSLTPAPTITTTATSTSAPGKYDITATGAVDANYNISYKAGTLTIIASSDASLSSISISPGTLTASGVNSYTAAVANSVTSVNITPTAGNAQAIIKVNGSAVASGSAATINSLAVGANNVAITVTAQDGTINNYTITVTRAPSANAGLTAIGPSATPLSPSFTPATTSYTLSVSNATTFVTVKPVTGDANATMAVNNTPLTSGTVSGHIALSVGSLNTISIAVTAQDGVTKKTYTITVTRAPATDATLSGLQLSTGTLSPVFAAGTTAYTASVSNATTSLSVTPTTNDPNATVTVNTGAATSGTAFPVTLAVGVNNISVAVTAQDGKTINTYTIAVTRAPSANAGLVAIGPSASPISPAFAPATTAYTLSVSNATATMTVKPVTGDAGATMTVNTVPLTSGTVSQPIALAAGKTTTISIVVTAQDKVTQKTYTIAVTRAAATDATLANLQLSSGTLSPAFAAGTLAYTASVNNASTTLSVTPTTNDPNATVTVNNALATSGTAFPVALAVGSNSVNVTVTAQDGTTMQTYTVTVTRAPSTNAFLASIGPGATPLSPSFTPGNTGYSISVSNATASMTVKPVTSDAGATMTVNTTPLTSGTVSQPVTLAEGKTTNISIVVTAQDNSTKKTYTVAVTRAPSADATLTNLQPSSGTLSPVFAPGTNSYTANASSTTSTITVTPTTTDPNATVSVNNGTAITSGTASAPITLTVGANPVTVVVTAQDGTTKNTYSISVTKAPSTNALLVSMNPSVVPLSPVFAQGTTSYTLNVSNATTSVTVAPVTSDPNATMTVNNQPLASGATSAPVALTAGTSATITTVVTAQDKSTTRTYVITVNRPLSSDASLSAVKLSSGNVSPAVSSGATAFTATVSNVTSSITITPTVNDPNATLTVNNTTATSGAAFGPIALTVGSSNVISITVTAQDGTTQTYTVTVTRALSANDNLGTLGSSIAGLTPAFAAATTSYTLSVGASISSMTIKPVTVEPNATMTINGTPSASGASFPVTLATGNNTIAVQVTAQDGVTNKTYTLVVNRAPGAADGFGPVGVTKPVETPELAEDGIVIHQAISPNGDGINDVLQIDNIGQYPDNTLKIMNRNGQLVYEAKGYDNSSKAFDGHSNKTGQLQLPGTYFYQLDYTINGVTKHKTGFIVLKY